MLGPRPRARATTGAAAVAVAVVLLLLLLPPPESLREGVGEAVGNAAHAPLMGAFALVLFALGRAGRPRYASIGLAAAGAALGTELLQPAFGRTGSVIDFVYGALGVAAAVCGVWAWRERGWRTRLLHAVLTAALLAAAVWPVLLELRASLWRSSHLPLLGDFESAIELRLWRDRSPGRKWPTTLEPSSEHVRSGRRSLAVHTGGGAWPGVIYRAGGADWSGYASLDFELYNPGELFRFTVRVTDAVDDRFASSFHRSLRAETGWNRFSIPLEEIRRSPAEREVDLSRVAHLYLYADGDRSRLFYVDAVRLSGNR